MCAIFGPCGIPILLVAANIHSASVCLGNMPNITSAHIVHVGSDLTHVPNDSGFVDVAFPMKTSSVENGYDL